VLIAKPDLAGLDINRRIRPAAMTRQPPILPDGLIRRRQEGGYQTDDDADAQADDNFRDQLFNDGCH
jgi:hypothetical protein